MAKARSTTNIDLVTSSDAGSAQRHGRVYLRPVPSVQAPDHFVEQDGLRFAGRHLIIDLWGGRGLDDMERIDRALRDCVEACRATLLHIHLHKFGDGGGVSGLAVLAESHISVHTWPEHEYAAFDVFMCGDTDPGEAIQVLKTVFESDQLDVIEHRRGIL